MDEGAWTLAELRESAPVLHWRTACALLAALCRELAPRHAERRWHRELGPQQIQLVVARTGAIEVRLDGGHPHQRRVQISTQAAFGYRAPEQLRPGEVSDGRADIYAIGALGYELVTGTTPYEVESLVDAMARATKPGPLLEPPSARYPAGELPPEVDALLLRCLAFDVDDRWPDVGALEQALTRAAGTRSFQLAGPIQREVAPLAATSAPPPPDLVHRPQPWRDALRLAAALGRDLELHLAMPSELSIERLRVVEAPGGELSITLGPVRAQRPAKYGNEPTGLDCMSPELLLGDALVPQTAVYRLGALLYTLLVGHPPFPEARGAAGVITAMLTRAPLPPSQWPGRDGIPPQVDALVLRALAREPAARHPDLPALLAAMAAVAATPEATAPRIPSARDLLRDHGPLPWRRALDVVRAACAALAPTRDRPQVPARVLPEGLLVDESRAGATVVTLGPAPRRPPILKGFDDVDAAYGFAFAPGRTERDAVYNLGVIAYELLVGHPVAPLQHDHDQRPPKAPSQVRPGAAIPVFVDAIVMRALAWAPSARQPSLAALAAELDGVLGKAPASVRPAASQAAVTEGGTPAKVAPRRQTRRGHAVAAAPAPPPVVAAGPSAPAGPSAAPIYVNDVVDAVTSDAPGQRDVRRGLPTHAGRTLGAWRLLAHAGPMRDEINVPMHRTEGIATATCVFAGALEYRDEAGTRQLLRAGSLGWLAAPRATAHAERSLPGAKEAVHLVQLQVALPPAPVLGPAQFRYYPASALPTKVIGGVRVRVLLGEAFGARSPVATPSPLLLIDVRLPAGASAPIAAGRAHDVHRALYVVAGTLDVGGTRVGAHQVAFLAPHLTVPIAAVDGAAHVLVLGSAARSG